MKKYSIHNNLTGLDFIQYGDQLVMHPAYGLPDRWVPTELLTPSDVLRVLDTRPAPSLTHPNATESLLPADHVIVVADATQEIHDKKMQDIRAQRNLLIAATDWTQLADAPLSSLQKQAMRDYRQALRDLPANITNIDSVVWPVKPEVQ